MPALEAFRARHSNSTAVRSWCLTPLTDQPNRVSKCVHWSFTTTSSGKQEKLQNLQALLVLQAPAHPLCCTTRLETALLSHSKNHFACTIALQLAL